MAGGARTYYDVLGVSPGADAEELRRAYRRLALRYHPDRAGHAPEAVARFHELLEAWETLSDPDCRDRYDLRLRAIIDAAFARQDATDAQRRRAADERRKWEAYAARRAAAQARRADERRRNSRRARIIATGVAVVLSMGLYTLANFLLDWRDERDAADRAGLADQRPDGPDGLRLLSHPVPRYASAITPPGAQTSCLFRQTCMA